MQAVPTRKARRRRNQKRKIKIRAGKPKKDKKDDKEKDNNKKVRKTQTAKLKSDTGSPNGHSKAEDKHLVAAMAKAKVTDVAGEPLGKLGPIPGEEQDFCVTLGVGLVCVPGLDLVWIQ